MLFSGSTGGARACFFVDEPGEPFGVLAELDGLVLVMLAAPG